MNNRYVRESDVVKAIDKHTREDGTLDDDISCILEEVKSVGARGTNVPGKWIPCSERLPEVDGMYTTTLSGELVGTEEPFVGQSYFEDGYWEEDGDCVIAWMPLPEPYREVTDEENLESRR